MQRTIKIQTTKNIMINKTIKNNRTIKTTLQKQVHIQRTRTNANQTNNNKCKYTKKLSIKKTNLPKESFDYLIMVDVYHELEYPYEIMKDIYMAISSWKISVYFPKFYFIILME